MSPTIVITGFGPFSGFDDNPSSAVLESLKNAGIPDFDGEVVILKVSVEYDTVQETVDNIWKTYNPVMVVHIGAHPFTGCVKLEQQSFRAGYFRYDVCGRVPDNNQCCVPGEDILKSSVDCASVVSKVSPTHSREGLEVKVSHDPGRYLCGFSYYLSLLRGRALFIHVPAFDEVCTKENIVALLRDVISEAVKEQ